MSITMNQIVSEALLYEVPLEYCRKLVTLASGVAYKAGEVLGKVTANGKYTQYDNSASDGTETAVAVLVDYVDASSGDAYGVAIVRGPAVIAKTGLNWETGQSAGDKTAAYVDLESVGIVARDGV